MIINARSTVLNVPASVKVHFIAPNLTMKGNPLWKLSRLKWGDPDARLSLHRVPIGPMSALDPRPGLRRAIALPLDEQWEYAGMARAQGGGLMPRKQWLPLTYPPKIPGVLDGSISQTIRIDSHFNIHDLIAFHGWQGKSRRSPWSFRTPWFELNQVIEITAFPWGFVCVPRSFAFHREWKELDCIAARDGVVPATGEELGRVLRSYHNIPESGKPGQILRW